MSYKINDSCISCSACTSTCPVEAIKEGTPYTINDACVECGACVSSCPVGAIEAP